MRVPLFLALSLTACAIALQGQESDPRALIQRAMQLQQSGHDEEAVSGYREFLRLVPNEPGAHSNLGVLLTKLGRYQEAIVEYEAARALLPNDAHIALNLALAYSKRGDLTRAAELLRPAHAADPGSRQITTLLADAELRLGHNREVVALLEPLTQQDNDLAVDYLLGTALIRDGRVEQGQVRIERILSRGDSAEARFLLGQQMFEAHDYPSAANKLKSALDLDPTLPELRSYYGQALLFTGDPNGASEAFRAALATDPNDRRANLGLGEILAERGDAAAAIAPLTRVLDQQPNNGDALAALGHALLRERKLADARARLEAGLANGMNTAELHRDLAAALEGLHDPEAAKREMAKAEAIREGEDGARSGPRVGDPAPPFRLTTASGDAVVSLADFRGKRPVLLVFGSYSCPNFREAAPALKALEKRYGADVKFLLVYIREAHTGATWETARNDRDDIHVTDAITLASKVEHARMCERSLHLGFSAVVDGLDDAVDKAYAAWPSRAVLVDQSGRVAFSTPLTELDFDPKQLERALQSVSTHPGTGSLGESSR